MIKTSHVTLPMALAASLFATSPASAQENLPPPQVSGVPIPPGQIEAAVAAIDRIVEETMADSGIPGVAIAAVHSGEVVYAKGFGVRHVGDPAPVTPDTVFQLASLSKPVGASVIARAVGEDVVGWDTPVTQFLPWFVLSDTRVTEMLTIADLYSHRSGLPGHAGDDLEDLGYGREAVLERLRFLPLGAFRVDYAYTNFGLTAAAEAVAKAAAIDWAELSETAIYAPLGMTNTSSRHADFMAHENRAHGHVPRDGDWVAAFQREPDAQSPAGGVSSSANDMAEWMLMMLGDGVWRGDRIVDADALLAAVSPHSVSGPPATMDSRASFYGYGIGVGVEPSGRVSLSHSGAFALGAATRFILLPSAELGIVILSNAAPIGAVEAIGASFMDMVQFGRVTRDWNAGFNAIFAPMMNPVGEHAGDAPPENPDPARALSTYAGTWTSDYFGPATVRETEDGLTLGLGPAGLEFPLRHWSGDEFVYELISENAPEGSVSSVTFADGRMTVEVLNANGLGVFARD